MMFGFPLGEINSQVDFEVNATGLGAARRQKNRKAVKWRHRISSPAR